jgi:peptide/nickel transport system ATP-binding protein
MTNQASLHPTPLQMQDDSHLLEVNHLKKYFPITKGLFGQVAGFTTAAGEVSFFICQGETVGLVGESGCGKTTAGRCVGRAYAPTGGEMLYRRADGAVVDLAKIQGNDIRPYRKDVRLIFQDPYSSLNPRMTVFENISEVLKVKQLATVPEMKEMVERLPRNAARRKPPS